LAEEKVFVTGASGYIGSALLARLESSPGRRLVCLSRRPPADSAAGVRWVQGDLCERGAWTAELAGARVVVHLAACTGKAPAGEHERVNFQGTRNLLDACRAAGVPRLLFVSTIATSWPEKRRDPYARSKERAEGLVRASQAEWTVFRPTLVLGRGAPAWHDLCRLARPRVTPLFAGGRATVQPVALEDVVDCLVAWLREGGLARETIDIGGPEILSFRDLLARVRRALRGSDSGMIRLPWRTSQAVLGLLEPLLFERLPLTAGQLYVFRYDGTAFPSDFMVRRRDRLQRLDPQIQRLSQG
jgi:NADH dehydrogenase